MERLDIESHSSNAKPGKCRFISLRKYSLPICMLEAIAICLFVYFILTSNSGDQTDQIAGHDGWKNSRFGHRLAAADYKIYTNGTEQAIIVSQLYGSCNLRKHDLAKGVACHSNKWFACSPVEQEDNHIQLDVSAVENRNLNNDAEPPLATVISTTRAGRRMFKERIVLNRTECKPQLSEAHLDPCRFSTRVVIQLQARQQQIIGWGGALTDSSIQNILALTTNGTRCLLDDYFGIDGLRYNMIRITIGGSDFSERFYTNDDSLRDDLLLEKFKLREEDLLYKIPILKFIKREYASQWLDSSNLKLFASMWSPPVWMKTNNHFNKGQLKGSLSAQHWSVVPSSEVYFNALAELKSKFLMAYQSETGLAFWGLTVMNEPLFAIQPFLPFNTMIFPREDYANYVAKYLGPKIRMNEQLRHIKLIAHDDNRRYLINYTMPILENTEAKKYIDGVATHSYADEAYDLLDVVYDKFHNTMREEQFFVLPTELCSGHLPFMGKALIGNWHRGMHYALDIIRSLQHSAAGWVDWNMALDLEGGPGWLGGRLDAPIIVDKQSDSYHKSPMFYVIGQFSRYIPPGSVRVRTKVYNDLFDGHFEVVTFALPQSERLATVVVNNNPYPIEVKFKIARGSSLLANNYYSYTCEADSVTTILHSSKL